MVKSKVLNWGPYIQVPKGKQLYKCTISVLEPGVYTLQDVLVLGAFFTDSEDKLVEALNSNKLRGVVYDGTLVPLQKVLAEDFQDVLERAQVIMEIK